MESRIYTVKVVPFGGGTPGDEIVRIVSAGFAKDVPLSVAAKTAGCDFGELHHQLTKRGGMTHVIRHGAKHWFV